jgi:uncharacterized surface protein with fasciclin (FAS1) repeats
MKKLATIGLAIALAVSMALPATASKPGSSSIVEIVLADDGEFDVLQAAVIEAGLVDALNGKRQLTVFAPTDAAFVATFEGILGGPLSEADVIAFVEAGGVDAAFGDGALAGILGYHVIPGRRIAQSVLAAPSYNTLSGERLGRSELISAGVNPANISASNGVVHILTTAVLLP